MHAQIVHVQLAVAAFTVAVGPMIEDIEDFMTSNNEVLLLFFSQYIFLFSKFTTDPSMTMLFGTIYLILLSTALTVNIVVVVFMTVKAALYKRKLLKPEKKTCEKEERKGQN